MRRRLSCRAYPQLPGSATGAVAPHLAWIAVQHGTGGGMGSRLLVEVSDFVDAALDDERLGRRAGPRAPSPRCATRSTAPRRWPATTRGGAGWADSYDRAAQSVLRATGLAVNGSYRLSARCSGGPRSTTPRPMPPRRPGASVDDTARREPALRRPPSGRRPPCRPTAGRGHRPPARLGADQRHREPVWPDGHQDRLHRAATGLDRWRGRLEDAASWAPRLWCPSPATTCPRPTT